MSRIKFHEAFPEGMQAMIELSTVVHKSGLESGLLHLVFTRASQINGCAYCLNMHTTDALKGGERDVRLYLLNAWRETDIYTEREQAALALTEAMTTISKTKSVPDDVWEAAAEEFEPNELAALMLAITQINSWNRLSIATGTPPDLSY